MAAVVVAAAKMMSAGIVVDEATVASGPGDCSCTGASVASAASCCSTVGSCNPAHQMASRPRSLLGPAKLC